MNFFILEKYFFWQALKIDSFQVRKRAGKPLAASNALQQASFQTFNPLEGSNQIGKSGRVRVEAPVVSYSLSTV